MISRKATSGVSIIELVIWIAIAGLLLVAMSILLGNGLRSNRFQFEQVLITEDARRQLELMSDTLRDARNDGGNNWLVAAEDNSVTIRGDADFDGVIEQVRYFLDGDDLKRGITELDDTEIVRTVARSIRNSVEGDALFTYYDAEGNQLAASAATATTVERISLQLAVDVSEQQVPGAGEIITEVKPRAEDTQTTRLWPVSLDLPGNPTALGPGGGAVEVTTTNPATNESDAMVITMTDLNDGRVGTYTGDYYTHLNYQDEVSGSYLPNWYAWVGPIVVGTDGTTTFTANEKFTHNQLCLGNTLDLLLVTCSVRQVSDNGFTKQYFPILTYTQPDGTLDYVRNITYGGAAGFGEAQDFINTIDTLYIYDPNGAGALVEVGVFGVTDVLDAAYNSAGELYIISSYTEGSDQVTDLLSVDTNTGAATFVAEVDRSVGYGMTAAGFLGDDRLLIGGEDVMKIITLSGGAVSNISSVPLTYSSSVRFSGDLIGSSDSSSIWFIGTPSDFSGDYCYESDLSGSVSLVSSTAAGSANTVWGATCTSAACDTIRIYTSNGQTKLLDPATCTTSNTQTLIGQWEGAANAYTYPGLSPSPTPAP